MTATRYKEVVNEWEIGSELFGRGKDSAIICLPGLTLWLRVPL
jgi:hypothetical protein